jgi:signal transduction histidine kinase/heme-degrading monooxygenase HmoA
MWTEHPILRSAQHDNGEAQHEGAPVIVAVSRFRVANGREDAVAEAFLERPHLVDSAPGFLGLEVFTPPRDAALFYLVTRWTDEPSFRTWHQSEDHRLAHRFIPKGLKLDPAFTKVVVLERLRQPSLARPLAEVSADAAPFLADFLAESRAVHVIAALRDGTVVAANGAAGAALKARSEELVGRSLWPFLTAADGETLRRRVAAGARRPQERFLLNLVDTAHVPHTLDCQIDVQPDGFVVIGEPRPRDERLLEERLLQLNNELAVLAREHARQAKDLERANERLTGTKEDLQAALQREREARETAEAAVLARDEFLSVAAHEVRQPLAALRGYAQLMLRRLDRGGALEPEQVRELTQTIFQQADRMNGLIEQLLNVSRIEAGKLALDRRRLDLVDLVEEAVAAAQATTTRHRLALQAPSSLAVEGDPLRLGQVAGNLLSNAIKYSPQGGDVDVEVARLDDGDARLAVRDRGVGIPRERRERIFERFYQAHGEGRLGGLGLGLYITHQIVELHGGHIWVEAPEDGGTRFVVTLPALAEPLAPAR